MALPLILCIGAIVTLMYAVLAGVAHRRLYMFSIDVSELSIDASDAAKIFKNLDIKNLDQNIKDSLNDIDLDSITDKLPTDVAKEVKDKVQNGGEDLRDTLKDVDLDDIKDDVKDTLDLDKLLNDKRRSVEARAEQRITAESLDLADKYEVSLWGYCRINNKGDRDCTHAKFNWASKLNTDVLDDIVHQSGVKLELPDELDDALNVFKKVSKWTQIAFVICLLALGIELIVGFFANFTRVISCLIWLWAGITACVVIATAALATVTATVIVGGVEAVGHKWNADATINTSFLATIWIGAAFAIAASSMWIFTICCCKPESRSDRKKKRASDNEKLLPGNQRGAYGQLEDAEAHGGLTSAQASPGFAPTAYNAPSYPRSTRADLAYEPYSNRA